MADADAAPAPRPKKRWRRALIAFGILLLLLSLSATWLLQPEQLVPLILDRTGKTLGLEITADGVAEARLRGQPQLVVRNIVARAPGDKTAILRAERVLLALPWSSLRSGGKDPVIERVELDVPVFDLPALQAWLAKRPPGEDTNIPTLTDGLRVIDGRIDNGDWRIENIDLRLPSLHPQRPVNARLRGRYVDAATGNGTMKIPFDLAIALTRPANDADVTAVGTLAIESGDWQLPATVALSGPLHLGDDAITMTPATLGISARYESGGTGSDNAASDNTRLPFSLGLHGPLRYDAGTWVLAPVGVALRGDEPVPSFDARGAFALGKRLVIELDGALPQWPASWPALPVPVSNSTSPLPFSLRYTGQADLADVARLRLQRDATDFDGRFKLYDVLGWIDQVGGSPLPPLDGRLRSPELEISGAVLEGVDVVIDDEDVR
ncbi:MAG: hypothetical protein V4673_17750 [Pseudomonadota bacterium]